MQELAQTRIALKPAVKEVDVIFEELNTEIDDYRSKQPVSTTTLRDARHIESN